MAGQIKEASEKQPPSRWGRLKAWVLSPDMFLKIGLAVVASAPVAAIILYIYGGDFGSYGTMGDTVGGLTAPFINAIAAWLIYRSFQVQNKANKQQREELAEEKKRASAINAMAAIDKLFEQLNTDVVNYRSITADVFTRGEVIGLQGLKSQARSMEGTFIGKLIDHCQDGHVSDFYSIVIMMANIAMQINRTELLDDDKKSLKARLKLFYEKVGPAVWSIQQVCSKPEVAEKKNQVLILYGIADASLYLEEELKDIPLYRHRIARPIPDALDNEQKENS